MKIKVADLVVEMDVSSDFLLSRLGPYLCDESEKTDITIDISKQFYIDRQAENPHMTLGECECLWSGGYFYEQLTRFGGVMLHASCVEYEGKAYLFSARSGTGKSTHTHLWLKYLPGSRIINDDKPAIRCIDGVYYAYGTPWSGKTALNENVAVEPAGVAFIERSETNRIERLTPVQALKHLMWQTVRPTKEQNMDALLTSLDKFISQVPVYKLYCNISDEAGQVAYNAMKEGR